MNTRLFLLMIIGMILSVTTCLTAQTALERIAAFRDHGLLVVDDQGNEVLSVNKELLKDQFSPCSTFKIVHTLFALDCGVAHIDSTFKWDGKKRSIENWNKDQDWSSAMRYSAVWVYQSIARNIGPERMQQYLQMLKYGNQDMSAGIDRFWLGSSLKISGMQQLDLLKSLHDRTLPFSIEHQAFVEQIMSQAHLGRPSIFGKTGGSRIVNGDRIGWFVGYKKMESGTIYFVLFIADDDGGNPLGSVTRSLVFDVINTLDQ